MSQLTHKACISIEILRNQGLNSIQIGKKLGYSDSTIYREIKRYSIDGYYDGEVARSKRQLKRVISRGGNKRIKKGSLFEKYILEKVKLYWSPEQIAGRRNIETKEKISKDTIYAYIKKYYPDLIKMYFRRKGKKYKHSKIKEYRILDRKRIDERPKEVDEKKEKGHREGDTIIGKGHKGAIPTLVERTTLFLRADILEHKYSVDTSMSMYHLLKDIPPNKKKTITVDNGSEFTDYKVLECITTTQVYFAHPYKSRQRGCNENTNGLLRQFIPKGTDFSTITKAELDKYVELINNRPRKKLGYKTPNELFKKYCIGN